MAGDLRLDSAPVKKKVLDSGFCACGISASGKVPEKDSTRLQEWLALGHQASMSWMARNAHKRAAADLVLPGASSVVSVGFFTGLAGAGECRAGRVASYALTPDYHSLMLEKLDAIASWIGEAWGGVSRTYVDTGPVLERAWAAQAGLGWIGKSSMLVSKEFGTCLMLGEIITTVPFATDAPEKPRCGSCRRCMERCPSGAFSEARLLDSRRCLAFLTIENKGEIPVEFRSKMGDRIFGCDECQQACPWNRFTDSCPAPAMKKEWPPDGAGVTDLRGWLKLNENNFREIFKNYPVLRAGHRGFLRNVCVALGNCGTEQDLPELERMTQAGDGLIAEHASWAIAAIRRRVCWPPIGL